MRKLIAVAAALLLVASCAKNSDIFNDIGTHIASPTSITIDVASNRLYLVNSNDKVLYEPAQGNFQVYDITDPLAPVLISTAQTLSFTGQLYFDAATKRAFAPNRYSANDAATTGLLYGFDVDESSAGFMTFTQNTLQNGSFGIQCCYPPNRAWITSTWQNGNTPLYQYVDLGGDLTPGSVSLATTLDSGGQLTNCQANYEVLIGSQAFISRLNGGIMVMNLDEADVPGAVPMDYLIGDIEAPRGLATDGAYLYVAGEGNNLSGDWTQYLLILDIRSLVPDPSNTTTRLMNKVTDNLLVAMIQVGGYPQEVLLSTDYAFVTNQNDNTVSVISLASSSVAKIINVGNSPVTMALYRTAGGVDQYVYVGNMFDNTLSIIDIPSLTVVATYP